MRYHYYEEIRLRDFLEGLIKTNNNIKPHRPVDIPHLKPYRNFSTVRAQMIMVKRLFQRLNSALTDNTILLVDVGDALFIIIYHISQKQLYLDLLRPNVLFKDAFSNYSCSLTIWFQKYVYLTRKEYNRFALRYNFFNCCAIDKL